MSNRGIITLDPESTEKSCNGDQACFLSKQQIAMVGDIFALNYNGKLYYFKILEILFTPTDFAKKFLWRLCGQSTKEDLDNVFKNLNLQDDMIFVHIYAQIPWSKIKNMVTP